MVDDAGGSGGSLSAVTGGAAGSSGGASGAQAGGGPSAGAAGTGAILPAQLLDLQNWYLTLPTGLPKDPDDVYQPELALFQVDPYFRVSPDGKGVLFMAHAGGVTTSGSSYPRSELREMVNGGTGKAAWSTTEGRHTMIVTQAITHLGVVKPDMVAAQIHDADSDEVMIRLIKSSLHVEYKPTGVKQTHELTPSYQLGIFYTVKIEASDGEIRVFYEDMTTPALSFANTKTGCYFKAGAYTHSSVEKGDAPDAYGEVVISALEVRHE